MKTLRRAHLFLGCFFAPLLIFYVATGWYQTLHPDRKKDLGHADDWIGRMTSVHIDQIYPAKSANSFSPGLFRVLVVLMSIALIVTVLIGVYLALRALRQKWTVWAALALGVVTPILLLWLGQKR